MDPCEERTDNAVVVPVLLWRHKNPVSFAAAAALALDDLSIGHQAAKSEGGKGGSSEAKCCVVNINERIFSTVK